MTRAQNWFILIWLSLISALGAVALVLGQETDASGWVFSAPLILLGLWGIARFVERNF